MSCIHSGLSYIVFSVAREWTVSLVYSRAKMLRKICKLLLKDTGHYWKFFLSKTSLLTWCISSSQHMHRITNLCKFGLNWSTKLQDNNERKTPLLHLCAFRCLILRPQKLRYFRGSQFSHSFILSTALHCSIPSKVLCQ